MKKPCLALAVMFATVTASAQECDRLLEPDVTAINQDTTVRLAYLHTLDKKQYEKHKTAAGVGGSIPVEGVPIKGTANYDDFKQKLQEESRRTQFSMNVTDSRWYYATRVPPERTQGFVDCINPTGLKLRLVSREEGAAVLKLSWHPSADAVRSADLSYGASLNVANLNELPTSIGPYAERVITVRRKAPNETMIVSINTGTHPAFYSDPPIHKPPPAVKTLATSILTGNPCVVRLTVGIGTLVPNTDYTLRYTESGNRFAATGRHRRTNRSETHTYSNASLNRHEITVWGAIMTFSEDGRLQYKGRDAGAIRCT